MKQGKPDNKRKPCQPYPGYTDSDRYTRVYNPYTGQLTTLYSLRIALIYDMYNGQRQY